MSFKAYFVRLKTPEEVDNLHTYIQNIGIAGFVNYFGRMKKRYMAFKKGDVVAAITVDRADLAGSFIEEGLTKPLYFKNIYSFPTIEGENNTFDFLYSSDETWPEDCKAALRGEEICKK